MRQPHDAATRIGGPSDALRESGSQEPARVACATSL
jgi:hypothetical protein